MLQFPAMDFTSRTSWRTDANPLSVLVASLKERKIPILDLTVSNPTHCQFHYLSEKILAPLASPAALFYDPDPRGLLSARKAICRYYQKRGISVDPGQIFITANTSEAYSFAFHLLFEPQDVLLVPQPNYPLLDFLAGLHDVELNHYVIPRLNRGIQVLDSPDKPRNDRVNGILLVNPNNPTGNYLHAEELKTIAGFCHKHDLAILSDEVFWDYPLAEKQKRISLAAHDSTLTLTFNGISKILGLPQMKLSWLIVNGPKALRQSAMERLEVIADIYLSAATPNQHALETWLEQAPQIQDEILSRVRVNYQFLKEKIEGHSAIKLCPVEGGWHVPLQMLQSDRHRGACHSTDEAWSYSLLKEHHVLTHPGYLFDFQEENIIVLSLIVPEIIFQHGVERILR